MPENLSQERLDYVKSRMIAIYIEKEFLIKECEALEEYILSLESLSTASKKERVVNSRLRNELIQIQAQAHSDSEAPQGPPDSVWETLRKISGMGDTVKIMCSDRSIDTQNLMLAGFRGAVRLAKQALKDAGK